MSKMGATLLLGLRWLLLPLLLLTFGLFIEGPPTRLAVHSPLFLLSSFGLSLFAAQYVNQRWKTGLWFTIIQAVVIPVGYILVMQRYYNGAKDMDYTMAMFFFSLFMSINGLLYLGSLCSVFGKKKGTYVITLYTTESKSHFVFRETGTKQSLPKIVLDGFSTDRHINLTSYWNEISSTHPDQYSTEITTFETIVKFSETMQLTNDYILEFKRI
jgi:hypothetical protein